MADIDLTRTIPTRDFPSIHNYTITELNQPLVSLSKAGFKCDSQYYKQGIAGALKDCYARTGVVDRLKEAEALLPKGLRFKIYDAYRPIEVQERLWKFYRTQVKQKNPTASEEELDKLTSFFVSKPSYDVNNPSLHNTGGAIDLTIITDNGYALNMGTLFDDFTNRAWTNHFEVYAENDEVRQNRRLLYNVMTTTGFTNLPSEWWHYDLGTKFWAYFKNTNALYKGILNHDLPDAFPLF